MAFCCQIHYRVRLVPVEQIAQGRAVANVDLCEGIAWMANSLRIDERLMRR